MIKINHKQLKNMMKIRGWSQRDLARELDFSESYITHLFKEDREPSREFMDRIIQKTGLPFGSLFFCPETYQNVSNYRHDIQKGKDRGQKSRKNSTQGNLARNSRQGLPV